MWDGPGHPQAEDDAVLSFLQLDRIRTLEIQAAVLQTWAEPLDSRHICRSENTSSFYLPPHPSPQKTQILTKRWQSRDLWHRPCKFGVAKHARDVLSLIHSSRKEVGARLCVRVGFLLSLRLYFRVQHQRDIGVGSPPGWNAGDHPELTSPFRYHFCFNGHIWCCCRAEEKYYTFTQTTVFASKFKSHKSQWDSFGLFLFFFFSSRVGSQNWMIWILAKHGSWGASAGIFWKVLTRDYHLSHLLAGAAAKSRCLAQLLQLEPRLGEH